MMAAALDTERAHLRPLGSELVDTFHGMLQVPEVCEFLLDGERAPREFAELVRKDSDRTFGELGLGVWLIQHGGIWIGFAGFRHFDELGGEPELVVALLPSHTGHGLATETLLELVALAQRLGRPLVRAAVDGANTRSRRLFERLGFADVGTRPGRFGGRICYQREFSEEPTRERQALAALPSKRIALSHLWDGTKVADPGARMTLRFDPRELLLEVVAPYHGDPKPPFEPGPCPGLWEYEVVELFLLGQGERYLEVELGPHGHHLVLQLAGVRKVVSQGHPLLFEAHIEGRTWRGRARVPAAWFPPGLDRFNVTAIDGTGEQRRYWSWQAAPGPLPDFHRLDLFAWLRA